MSLARLAEAAATGAAGAGAATSAQQTRPSLLARPQQQPGALGIPARTPAEVAAAAIVDAFLCCSSNARSEAEHSEACVRYELASRTSLGAISNALLSANSDNNGAGDTQTALGGLRDACSKEVWLRVAENAQMHSYRMMLHERHMRARAIVALLRQVCSERFCDIWQAHIVATATAAESPRGVAVDEAATPCMLCIEDGADCQLQTGTGCTCGAIAHVRCLLRFCFDARADQRPHDIKCFSCRNVFSELDLRPVHTARGVT